MTGKPFIRLGRDFINTEAIVRAIVSKGDAIGVKLAGLDEVLIYRGHHARRLKSFLVEHALFGDQELFEEEEKVD